MKNQSKETERLQWVLVIMVVAVTLYMSVVNGKFDVINSLCTLCFGYYFGSQQSNPPPAPPV